MCPVLTCDEAARKSHEEVASRLQTDTRNGLSWTEAGFRLKINGYNEFADSEPEPLWAKYAEQFKNPLIILLLASASVSVLMKQYDDAISITVVSTFIQYFVSNMIYNISFFIGHFNCCHSRIRARISI